MIRSTGLWINVDVVEVEAVESTEFDDKIRRRGGGGRLVELGITSNRADEASTTRRRFSVISASLPPDLTIGSAVTGRRGLPERELESTSVESFDRTEFRPCFVEEGGKRPSRPGSGSDTSRPLEIGGDEDVVASSLASSSRDMIACG